MPSNNLARHSRRKQKQTRLVFDSTEPSSSTGGLIPAKIGFEGAKKFVDLSPPGPYAQYTDVGEVFPSGKKFAVVVESPRKMKLSGVLPFQPVSSPLAAVQSPHDNEADGTFSLLSRVSIFFYKLIQLVTFATVADEQSRICISPTRRKRFRYRHHRT
jgi:hypothetical protein